jgi:hypothetical protein
MYNRIRANLDEKFEIPFYQREGSRLALKAPQRDGHFAMPVRGWYL